MHDDPADLAHAYHEPLDELDEPGVIDLWQESWSVWGWTPVILGHVDAMRWGSIDGYLRVVGRLPTVNPRPRDGL